MNETTQTATDLSPRHGLPFVPWLRPYRRAWLRGDLAAGLTLAAYLLPAALGDASLANLPPQAGLFACAFSGLVFWLFCSSRHTTVTVTSAISLLIGASLGPVAGGDAGRFAALAAATALLVAAIAFVAWIVRAGAVIHFVPESVMAGFKCGVALYLASTQLPKLLGLDAAHGDFWENGAHLLRHLGEFHPASLAVGAVALLALVAGRLRARTFPVALIVVVVGIALAEALGLGARGVRLLGDVPRGLPTPGLPAIGWADANQLLPLAFACFLLAAVETVAIGRAFAARHGVRLDADREFLALAAANLAAGLGRGYPVGGGMSQSLVNESGGARTPLSGIVAAVVLLLCALFLSRPLRALPQPVLAAIVLVAISGLFDPSMFARLWRGDRREFGVAIVALFGVLGAGLLHGVLIGAVISMVQLIGRASRPHVALLGRIPGTRRFSDRERHPDNELIPGALIFRPEASLVYFNVEHVRDTILERARTWSPAPRLVVLDLSAAPYVDLQSAYTLADLADELRAGGVAVQTVETRSGVRDRLRAERLDAKLGAIDRFTSVADAIDHFTAAGFA